MAGNKRPQKKTSRRRRRRGNGKPAVRSGKSTSSSLSSMFARGVRSILSTLPGSGITVPVADIIFNAVGVSSNISKIPNEVTKYTADVRVTGLYGGFYITPKMFFGSMPSIGNIIYNQNGGAEYSKVQLQWALVRIVSLQIVARPTGKIGTQAGVWAMGFEPMVAEGEFGDNVGVELVPPLGFPQLRQMHTYCEGPAGKPLTIRYKPRMTDGSVAMVWRTASHICGEVALVYYDTNRESYTPFTAQDFQPAIDVTATLEFRGRTFDVPYTSTTEVTQLYVNSSNNVLTVCRESEKPITLTVEKFETVSGTPSIWRVNGTKLKMQLNVPQRTAALSLTDLEMHD